MPISIQPKLAQIIVNAADKWRIPGHVVYSVSNPVAISPRKFLAALSLNESSGGMFKAPRYESSYAPGGTYFDNGQRTRYKTWGALCCCSYSSFQIMYPTAIELGYGGTPIDLYLKDEDAIVLAIRYFEVRVFPKGTRVTLAQCADAYNSGNFCDNNVPEKYIMNFINNYNGVEI